MTNNPPLTFRRTLALFLLALAGSVTGVLFGPRIVAAFHGAPEWLLPVVMAASVLLALVAGYLAFRIAGRKGPR